MRARLIPIDGGPSVELVKDLTLVGRNDDCDLTLDHKSISKQHCVLVKTDGLILVRDLGSTNGTRVNGQRVRRAALLPNDNLAIANFKYQVKFGEDANASKTKKEDKTDNKLPIQVNELPDNYTT
jgi:pSer/pThr/pTyr-binding forkhead associated (FHA) protein